MNSPGDTQQYNDLTQLYSTYGDTELQSLAETFDDLTEAGQQPLKAEFARRKLVWPAPKREDGEENSPLKGFAADAPEECTFEFTELEDAYIAQSVLRSAGIESIVPSSELASVDTPRLIVAPADARNARLILSRPNLAGAASEAEAIFVEPTCPKCGAPDPLLEAIEPTNEWRCEACDHTWQDEQLI